MRSSIVALLCCACGAAPPVPQGCMSDSECRGDRICHQGRCLFEEEARAMMAGQLSPGTGPSEPVPPAPPEQAMFMGGPRHNGRAAARGPASTPQVQWHFDTQSRVFASPVVGPDGTIYAGSLDHTFTAIRPDGTLGWRFVGTDAIYSSAALGGDGSVYVGSHDRALISLTRMGQPRWRRDLGSPVDSSPVIGPDGTIFVTSDGLYAFDPAGNVRFHVAAAGEVRSSPAIHPTGLVLFGTTDGRLVAVRGDGGDGWETRLDSSIESAPSIADDGTIYVGTDRGEVVALSAQGRILWRFAIPEGSGPRDVRATPAIAPDGTIVFGSYDRNIYALTPQGTLRWQVPTSGRVRASARIDADGRIYVGSQDDHLYAISPDGHVLWSQNLGQDIDSTAAIGANNTLYVGSDDGRVYALH